MYFRCFYQGGRRSASCQAFCSLDNSQDALPIHREAKALSPCPNCKRGRWVSMLSSPGGSMDYANTDDDNGIEDAVETTQPSRKKITISPV